MDLHRWSGPPGSTRFLPRNGWSTGRHYSAGLVAQQKVFSVSLSGPNEVESGDPREVWSPASLRTQTPPTHTSRTHQSFQRFRWSLRGREAGSRRGGPRRGARSGGKGDGPPAARTPAGLCGPRSGPGATSRRAGAVGMGATGSARVQERTPLRLLWAGGRERVWRGEAGGRAQQRKRTRGLPKRCGL